MRQLVAVAMMFTMLSGCAAMREDRSLCIGICTGTGFLLGATAGGLASGLTLDQGKNGEIAAATGGGAVLGSLIGWALSNAICEEPPPPPPAPVVRTPPPPPPPPTERRGG